MTDLAISSPGTAGERRPESPAGGRFRLDDRVGELSGTSLWKGTDEFLRRPVAVYLLPPSLPVVSDYSDLDRSAEFWTGALGICWLPATLPDPTTTS